MSRLPVRALILLLIATLCWPLQELTGGMLMRNHHAAQVVWLRYAAHLALLLAVLLPWKGAPAFATTRPLLQALRGLCMFGMPAGFILAVDYTSTRWIWIVFWTMPAMALVGAWLLLRERPPLSAWAGAALGVAAAAAIMRGSPGALAGTLAALVMGGSFAGYIVLSRLLRHERLGASLLWTGLGAFVPISLLVGRVWTPVAATDLVPALLTGVLSILILGAFDLSLEDAPVALVAPLIPIVLVWEVLLGGLAHGRPVTGAAALGSALALAGTATVLLARARSAGLRPGAEPVAPVALATGAAAVDDSGGAV